MTNPIEPSDDLPAESFKCPWCDVVKTLRGLCCHAGRIHRVPSSDVHKAVLHNGANPLCKCGCGEPTQWLQRRFGEYLRGHNGFSSAARTSAKEARKPVQVRDVGFLTRVLEAAVMVSPPSEAAVAAASDASSEPEDGVLAVCSIPTPAVKQRKSSMLELSGGWIDCGGCEARWPKHMRVDECPKCGPRAVATRSSFDTFANSVGLIAQADGTWRNTTNGVPFVVWLDSLYDHTLPGPLVKRNEVEAQTVTASDSGARVARFYEDEWLTRREVCESMLRHRLELSSRTLYARSMDLVELEKDARKEFFERCHLEGDARSEFCLALVKDGVTVCALSVRKPFHRSVHVGKLEVARFATELNVNVPGGLSRLVKAAAAKAKALNATSLMTYADGRLGDGDGYSGIGFERVGRNSPRLWWTDYQQRINRFAIRATSADGITQNMRAVEKGVVELWGCANAIFELKL